jgi:penicillin-binding protein 2
VSWFKVRSNILLVFFFVLFAVLILRLFVITGIQGEQWAEAANTNTIRTILTDAPRGAIYDRNGVLLAGNLPTYAVNFSRNNMTNDETNQSLQKLLSILDAHGEKKFDDFPIVIENGTYTFTYDSEIAVWLAQQEMPAYFTAEQAFNELRRRNGIDEGKNNYEAQQALFDSGIWPPINVALMEFTQTKAKKDFYKLFGIESTGTPQDAFGIVRKYYNVASYLSDEEAREMLAIRYELTAHAYQRYLPVKVASGISKETVVEIEENLHDLEGTDVLTESVRYYPYGKNASHILGYLGRISEENMQEYVTERGYKPADMIGLDGIEASQEDLLRGTDGQKRIQVNSFGEIMRTIGQEVTAEKGSDIMLTLDLRLQQSCEEILERGLEGIRTGGWFESAYGDYHFTSPAENAEVAAAVVIDVKTGEPLAIANIPAFDPNLFSEGITYANWDTLQGDNPRDPLSPRPLYNVAARTAVQPGSTFKPLTAIAAIESGLNPYSYLYDKGYVEIGDHTYTCLAWRTGGGGHGSENLFTAMQVSCNFYFYDIAAGRDFAKGGWPDLGYADNISIDKITTYANQFGLGVPSGAEIGETVVQAPTAERKLENTAFYLKNYLTSQAEYIFNSETTSDYVLLEKNIDEIVSWTAENPPVSEMISRMRKLGIKEDELTRTAEDCKYSYFNYAQWTMGDVFNIAIGQGENAFTPLQMANYFATIGNGGTLNKLSLIKAVEGTGEAVRPPGVRADIALDDTLPNIITAMRRVATHGTLSYTMGTLPVTVAGKTGTAERSGYINPPDEVEYIKTNLRGINAALEWEAVEIEMNRLMTDFPAIYSNPNVAVRRAVLNLSGRSFSSERIDAFKDTYDNFAWVTCLAPAEDPQIAVVVFIVQGGSSLSAAPITREIIGRYFELQEIDRMNDFSVNYNTFFNQDNRENTIEKVFGDDWNSTTPGAIAPAEGIALPGIVAAAEGGF